MISKLLIFIICLSCSVNAFTPPGNDPWYYQNNSRITFWVPDKVQHYWGSYALTEISNPYVAGILGCLWEIKDDKIDHVGFSYRDLIADYLGIISSRINKKGKVKMWMSYSTLNREVMFHVFLHI